jgi:hypothetical protein
VLLGSPKGTDLEGVRDVLVAAPYELCLRRCALLAEHLGLLLGTVLYHQHLLLIKLLQLTVSTRSHRSIVILLSFIGHHVHELLLGEAIINLSAWLV